jgi:beta propeller repeat protein
MPWKERPMKYTRMTYRLGTALLVVLCIGAFNDAVATAAFATNSLISAKRLAPRPAVGEILPPSLSGGQLIWARMTSDREDAACEFHLYDVNSGVDRVLMTRGGDGTLVQRPVIHSHRFVYSMRAPSTAPTPTAGWDVFSYDLYTGIESRITTDPADQRRADINGDTLVYEDNRNGNSDIYAYDFRDGTESQLTSNAANQTLPSVTYQYVAYQDDRSGNSDIRTYDLYEHVEKRVTSNPTDQVTPAMGPGMVAYVDNRWGNPEIYLYSLWAKTYKRLTTSKANQYNPDMSEGRVVWSDTRTGNLDIYYYETRFGTTHNLTADPALQSYPDISGQDLAYLQSGALYVARLRYPSLSVTAPSTVPYQGRATIRGRLKTAGGTPIAGRKIIVQRSTDQMHWTTVATRTTRSDGTYSYRTGVITSRRYYRVTYKGGDTYLSARNWTGAIRPKVSLTRPSGPCSMKVGGFITYGYLKPHHKKGSHSVAITTFRKESGVWVYKKTFWATNQDYGSYTRYRGVVQLTKAGSWRIHARHEDQSHATTYSAWRYITVK